MPRVFTVTGGAAKSIVANTPTSLISLVGPATAMFSATAVNVSFDGVVASEKPILIELCQSTEAGAATGATITPTQIQGNVVAWGGVAKNQITVEPTVLTPIWHWQLTPNGGVLEEILPLDREYQPTAVSKGLVLRVTSQAGAATVNARASMAFVPD